MPDLKIELTGNIEELAHQDYHGKRIHIKITDSDGYHIDSKIDIGVHKHFDIEQEEYWYSRELQDVLEYSQWRYFYGVISKAIEACESAVYLLKTILPKSAKWYLWEVVLSVRLRI